LRLSDRKFKWDHPDQILRLLDSPEPWTRYRLRVELLGQPESDPLMQAKRQNMLENPRLQALVAQADWPVYALQRHNNARHTF